MLSRLLVAVMMFVLIWTGTLLHDMAEVCRDHLFDIAAQLKPDSHTVAKAERAPALQAADYDELEHFHFAAVVSSRRPFSLQTIPVMPAIALFATNPSADAKVRYCRPPPGSNQYQSKLHLANRRLLI